MTKEHDICDRIEQTILQQAIGSVSESEAEQIARHIAQCERCARLARTLQRIQGAVADDQTWAADPRIEGQLAQRLARKTRRRWQWRRALRAVFEFRIPAYQAVLAAVMLVFVFQMLNRRPAQTIQPVATETMLSSATTATEPQNVQQQLQLAALKRIGVNAREDTSYFRFIVPSM